MKFSRFNIWVRDYPGIGENLLFNTRTQALLKITNSLRRSLEDIDAYASSDPELRKSIPGLIQNGIVVDDSAQDQQKLDDFFVQLKEGSDALPFEVTILTTYRCNLRCVYCFEESVKDDVNLDDRTSAQIISWIMARVKEQKAKRLYLV